MNSGFYEIAEANHSLQYPIALDSLLTIGRNLDLHEGKRVLDLACGKGELLIQWAREFGALGVGVDSNATFIAHAKDRANMMDVGAQVNLVHDDPTDYPQAFHEFDVVIGMRIGWLAESLQTSLELIRPALRKHPDSRIIVGEPFWKVHPTDHVIAEMDIALDALRTLEETLAVFDRANLDLLDFIQSDITDWDRYESSQWQAVHNWLLANPDHPDVDTLKQWNADNRRQYLKYGRQFIGWGIFVLG